MRGGDKAPVAVKAEAKARGNSPFFFHVDESRFNRSRCLTAFGRNRAASRPLRETSEEFFGGRPEPLFQLKAPTSMASLMGCGF
jgi:hypothetical protein